LVGYSETDLTVGATFCIPSYFRQYYWQCIFSPIIFLWNYR